MIQNPFRNKTEKEIMKSAQDKREIEERLKKVSESAKHILSSSDAIKYKTEFETATREIIRLMINNTETDPIKFFCFAKACLMKLDCHYTLLDSIEGDSKV